MATAEVCTSLNHDGVVYGIGDVITADKAVLDELAKAGVVERVKETPQAKAPEPAPVKAPEAPAKPSTDTKTKASK
jgi:hypothetical protein